MKEITQEQADEKVVEFEKWNGNKPPVDSYTKCCKKPMSSFIGLCFECEKSKTGICESEVNEDMLTEYHPQFKPYEETK